LALSFGSNQRKNKVQRILYYTYQYSYFSGESSTGNNVINLRTRSRNTYRRQNKSLDLTDEGTANVKKNDENVEENKPAINPESSTARTSKRIEQTKQENGDKVLKEMRRKPPTRADTDIKVENTGSHTRRNNSGQNRRRNKNRKQNIKEDNEKKNDENVEENNPTNNPELSTARTSKHIEQTKQENGDKVQKEIRRKTPKRADTDIREENPGSPPNIRRNNDGSHTRRKNNRQKKRRNKNRKQNIKEDIENTTKKPNSNIIDAKKNSHENTTENESNAEQEQNVEEETQTRMNDSARKQNENIIKESDSAIESQEKKVRAVQEDKVLETITEKNNPEESEEHVSINPSKSEETKPLTHSEKQNVVENADLLGLLLAQSDPSLVKILIDNSSPENLNVFLSHSNITVEELRDIIAY
jgi:hypothetical protein